MKKFALVALVAILTLFATFNNQRNADENNALGSFRSIVLDNPTKTEVVDLPTDSMVIVKLPVVPSNGYVWKVMNCSQVESVITEMKGSVNGPEHPEFQPLENAQKMDLPDLGSQRPGGPEFPAVKKGMPGSMKMQVLRFVGAGKGNADIVLTLCRPWLKDRGIQDYVLRVRSAGKFSGTFIAPEVQAPMVLSAGEITAPGLPASFDWGDTNQVTAVRDQGQCGSCWAFGCTAAVESVVLIKTGTLRNYSEQYLVSCNNDGWGCAGGWWPIRYYYDKYPSGESAAGGRLETSFPYTATDSYCYSPYTAYEKIAGWAYTDDVTDTPAPYYYHRPSVATVKQKIYDYGPVGTCVDCSSWGSYYGGVWNYTGYTSDHIVCITGWDDAAGCFNVKNSWGTSWGESGYIRLAYGSCLVGEDSIYVKYTSGTAPTITTQPVSRTVAAGATATFSVVASNATSYQWYKNGATISGATAASYTTPATTSSDNGATFYVRVSNSYGSVNSNTVTLTVTSTTAPTITTQPVSRTVAVGATATFSVVATGSTPLSYQWYKNGATISGATSASYTTPATTSADNGATFYVRVSNSVGSVNSNTVTLTVTSSGVPTITTQPVNRTVAVGATATFSVVATNATSYQWYKNGAAISGATSASYTTPATTSADNGATFYVRVSNSVGSVNSNTVTLTVTSSTTFVTVTSPNGGEQWQRGTTQTVRWSSSGVTNVKIELLKSGVLNRTITSSTAASTGSYNWTIRSTQEVRSDYSVRITSTTSSTVKDVSDAYFSITSSSVTTPTITTQPVSQTVAAGSTATFSVVATGTAPLSYQWYKNGATISGATSASYTTPATTSADNGATFYVRVSNSAGSVNSNTVTLTVSSTPGTLAVVSPNGGEQWARGYTYTIRWTAPSTTSYIDIALYRGTTFVQWITYYLPASSGSYNWTIPTSLTAASTYKVMILDYYTRTLTDYSDAAFQLY